MRKIGVAFCSAFAAAALCGIGWALLFAKFTEVPASVVYPSDWAALSVDAQNQWLIEHSVTISGFPALLHIFTNVPDYAGPLVAFLGLLLVCAFSALAINAFLQRRAP